MPGSSRLVTEPGLPSREVTVPCRVFSLETLAPSLLRRSPRALHLFRLGSRVFALQAPEGHNQCPRDPLLGFGPSSEVAQAPSRRIGTLVSQGRQHSVELSTFCGASLEVPAPSAFPRPEQRHEVAGLAFADRLRLQVFSTSWRLHPPRACRPYFMPNPLLGQPFRALFLSRSRALSPAPFPS
jgi:hypothetical protein